MCLVVIGVSTESIFSMLAWSRNVVCASVLSLIIIKTLCQWVMIMLWLASPLEEGKYIGVEAKECGREMPIIHVNMPHLLGEMTRI